MKLTQNWNRMDTNPSIQKILIQVCCCLMVGALLGVADADGGIYVGFVKRDDFANAFYNKTVDNTNPLNSTTQKGKVNAAESNASDSPFGFGYFVGYRLPLGDFYLSGEIDQIYYGGMVIGNIKEVGNAAGVNQLGESWAEDWTFNRTRSHGLTLKLGGSPGVLRSWKTNIYGLVGIHRVKTLFEAYYNGCFKPEPCDLGQFNSGVFRKIPSDRDNLTKRRIL